jgi:hypothetical protein
VPDQPTRIHTARYQLLARQGAQSLLCRDRDYSEVGERSNVCGLDASVVEQTPIVRHPLVRVANELAEATFLECDDLVPRRLPVPKNSGNIENRPKT